MSNIPYLNWGASKSLQNKKVLNEAYHFNMNQKASPFVFGVWKTWLKPACKMYLQYMHLKNLNSYSMQPFAYSSLVQEIYFQNMNCEKILVLNL